MNVLRLFKKRKGKWDRLVDESDSPLPRLLNNRNGNDIELKMGNDHTNNDEQLLDPRNIGIAKECDGWNVFFTMGEDNITIPNLDTEYIEQFKMIIEEARIKGYKISVNFRSFKKDDPNSVHNTFLLV